MIGWFSPAAVAVTMPFLASVVPTHAVPPPADPLEAYVVDTSRWPTVLVDVVVPWEYTTAEIEPAQIELDGGRVESVVPVQAIGCVVGLVIDDGPTVPRRVVTSAQGASVELVRRVGQGTAIALSTPSGMQTTPTTDRGASIARIAGITAGAPDVVPLNRLVLDAARRLAGTAWPDRHLVLVLGRPISEGPTLRELADIVARGNIRLHVVADPGIETGAIAALAEKTGGVASEGGAMLAEVDEVTAAVAHRVRVAVNVDGPGPLPLTLTINGDRFATDVDVPAAPRTSSTPTKTSPSGSLGNAPASTAAPEAATPANPVTSATASASAEVDTNGRGPLVIAALVAAVAVAGAVWLWARTRRRKATPAVVPEQPVATAQPIATAKPIATVAPARRSSPGPAPPDPYEAPAGDTEPAGRRRPPDRPHRATPRRRPVPTASSQPEKEPAQEHEPAGEGEWLVVGRIRLNRRTGDVFVGARRILLTPGEFAVLQLLMTRGGHGVTRDAIRAASSTGADDEPVPDPDDILAELRRKTGISGRGQGVRQERTLVYFFG
jgi:hypothetical protein